MDREVQLIKIPPKGAAGKTIDDFISAAHSALSGAMGVAETWRVRKDAEAMKEAARVLNRQDLVNELAEVMARAEWKIKQDSPPLSRKETGRGHKVVVGGNDFIKPQMIRDIRHALPETEDDFEAVIAETREKRKPATRAFFKEWKARRRIEDAACRKAAKEARPKLKDVRLYNLSIADLEKKLEPESVDCVFTDPPYDKAGVDAKVYEQLASFAGKVLKPGGCLVSLAGNMYLPDVLRQITEDARLKWNFLLSLSLSGGPTARLNAARAFVASKPVLWLRKPPWRKDQDYIRNLIKAPDVKESPSGTFHKWAQSVGAMSAVLRQFAFPGDTVVDPFCGGGALVIAAHRRGCKVIASDIDPECVKVTEGRLAAEAEKEAELADKNPEAEKRPA